MSALRSSWSPLDAGCSNNITQRNFRGPSRPAAHVNAATPDFRAYSGHRLSLTVNLNAMPVDCYAFPTLERSFSSYLFRFVGALTLFAAMGNIAAAQSAAGSAPAQPAHTRVDIREAPWNSVGKLQAVAGAFRRTCTAALVGPQTVLSSAHCVFNVRTQRYFLPSSLHFVAGLEGGRMVSAGIGRKLTIGPGYAFDHSQDTVGSDWALIELAAPADSAARSLSLTSTAPKIGTAVVLGGYARVNPNAMTADTSCRIVGYATDAHRRRLILHDCYGELGVSGAPLLVETEHGWRIVGVNAGRVVDWGIGLAVSTEQIRAHLQ